MKQLVVLSGKGGTGKTSLSAAFAHLAQSGPDAVRLVVADADVDAANLAFVMQPEPIETHDFTGGAVAEIDAVRCQECGSCQQVCRFDAVRVDQRGYRVDPIDCEGCAACFYVCPEQAIHMQPEMAGQWMRSESPYGPLFHAELYPAQENSGKLVTCVKQHARLWALDGGFDALLVDGPPGTGCPVIAAVSGADLALIVTEPTISGIHDLERILQITAHFRIATQVVINKADLSAEGCDQIRAHCQERDIPTLGDIPFDPAVHLALMQAQPVTAYQPQAPASQALWSLWCDLRAVLAL